MLRELFKNSVVMKMWNGTVAAILDTVFQILEITAAFVSQYIKRAITEQAVEILIINPLMARKKLASLILAEFVVFHVSYTSVQG